jgi:hypothetical protein
MKRCQAASAAENKAREHPPREKKREKQGGSAVKTVMPQDSHAVLFLKCRNKKFL